MNRNEFDAVVARCHDILNSSPDCSAEIDLLLGAVSRHPDWTEQDLIELQRHLVLDFANQLCERR